MPKTSREQITNDEKKIIQELQKNSKENSEEIAKRCGFSRQKAWRVIKRLEKNKTIWGYTAVVDDNKLGRKSYLCGLNPQIDFITLTCCILLGVHSIHN